MTDTSAAYKLATVSNNVAYRHRSVGEFLEWYLQKHQLTERDIASKLETYQPYIQQMKRNDMLQPIEFVNKFYQICTAEEKRMLLDAYAAMAQDYCEGRRTRNKR